MQIGREHLNAWYDGAPPTADEVVEIPVLMAGPLAAALEEAARKEGLTAAHMLRRILQRFLAAGGRANTSQLS